MRAKNRSNRLFINFDTVCKAETLVNSGIMNRLASGAETANRLTPPVGEKGKRVSSFPAWAEYISPVCRAADAYGHITLKTPVLVRSLKLSNVEPG